MIKNIDGLNKHLAELKKFDTSVHLDRYPLHAELTYDFGPILTLSQGNFVNPFELDGLQCGIFTKAYLKGLQEYRMKLVERINNFKVE